MLKHHDIWRAIDALAERHGLSASGLARKAGLSATSFNPTKRSANGRKRWPSTESIALILKATGSSLEDFTALASAEGGAAATALPFARMDEARFDEDGAPTGGGWESFRFPALPPGSFALEVTGSAHEPVCRDGDILILSPKPAPRRGDRVALQTADGAIHLGQLKRQTAQKIELLGFAAPAKPVSFAPSTLAWIYRVIWASQ